jgi:hypothetical protein
LDGCFDFYWKKAKIGGKQTSPERDNDLCKDKRKEMLQEETRKTFFESASSSYMRKKDE